VSVFGQARRWPSSSSTDRVRRTVFERCSTGRRRLVSVSGCLHLCPRPRRPAQCRRLDLPSTVSVHPWLCLRERRRSCSNISVSLGVRLALIIVLFRKCRVYSVHCRGPCCVIVLFSVRSDNSSGYSLLHTHKTVHNDTPARRSQDVRP